jgi:hypothetical protein
MDSARVADERALTSTELAVLMPVLIALVLVPFQVALWWHANQIVDAAAREAVDAAQVVTATADDGMRAAEWFLNAAGNITNPEVTVTRTADTVNVERAGNTTGPISTFQGEFDIDTGGGNDIVRVGTLAPGYSGDFQGMVVISGGAGNDERNDMTTGGRNTFAFAPDLSDFEVVA